MPRYYRYEEDIPLGSWVVICPHCGDQWVPGVLVHMLWDQFDEDQQVEVFHDEVSFCSAYWKALDHDRENGIKENNYDPRIEQ